MDESQTLLHLRLYFPEKPVDYLQSVYTNCNKNINSTIYTVAKSQPQKTNVLNGLLNCAQQLFCCSNKTTETLKEETLFEPEEFFKIDIGDHFAKALTEKFADDTLELPHGFKPVVEMPVAFGRQLFISYVESVYEQKKKQSEHLKQLTKVQNKKPDIQSSSNKEYSGRKPSFKTLPEHIENITQEDKSNQESKTILKLRLQAEEQRHQELMQSPMYLREIAKQHIQKQQHLLDIARKAQRNNNQELAEEYFEQAKLQALLSQKVNNIASEVDLKETRQKHPTESTIDLRHLEVQKAIHTLDIFVDNEINNLWNSVKNNKDLMVITGREEFSSNGSLKIKPSVIKRLGTRQLRYSELNPGLLKVLLTKSSPSSNVI